MLVPGRATLAVTNESQCIWPRRTIMLNFFIPVPAWLLATGYVAYDIFGALSHNNHGVSNAGHLGGTCCVPYT